MHKSLKIHLVFCKFIQQLCTNNCSTIFKKKKNNKILNLFVLGLSERIFLVFWIPRVYPCETRHHMSLSSLFYESNKRKTRESLCVCGCWQSLKDTEARKKKSRGGLQTLSVCNEVSDVNHGTRSRSQLVRPRCWVNIPGTSSNIYYMPHTYSRDGCVCSQRRWSQHKVSRQLISRLFGVLLFDDNFIFSRVGNEKI